MSLPVAIAAAGILLAATLLHYAFWSWRLAVPPVEDELLSVPTRDGWTLGLGRCRPRVAARLPPVLLVHGIAMNRQAFEFGVERYALAAHLARAGFDCFSLDHRGHGASRRGPGAPRRWNLDTYLREDVPAALDAVRAATGARQVLWVGHSQGALMGLAACQRYPERIAGIVALAAPAHFDVQERLKKLVLLRFTVLGRFTRVAARMLAPFAGHWHPAWADLAINMRNVAAPVYRRLLANGLENLEPGVLEQFATFIREDSFRSMDGEADYRAGLEGCAQPALFVAAERDGLAPPSVVQATYRRWGGPKRYVVFERDYGHTDLLLGRGAPEQVFPVVREFLLAHSGPASLAAALEERR
ncbi:alpha/beta fold hydrolase [Anaeromyxobacter dehalogenans]|uniref:Alpha/beta hydrolase fold-1 n=1 Tax=Anaeromyxobacter dehalogenans (strain 2CP-C) TaxID=290397 RepID=Q2IHF4_ANADE|nr:alpha/beta hydrolase [Anaeromyxobacter dehalogenans]ABC84011.1 Alpha/beta hydrolase fold-1 [Anaeromyxobacter dehalogenans 2CP-C]